MTLRPPGELGWAVTEQNIVGKLGTAKCEDILVTGPSLYAVIDGATDKHGLEYTWHGERVTGGKYAALVLAETIIGLDSGLDAFKAVKACTEALNQALEAEHPGLVPEQRPSASMTVYNPASRTLWTVGDTQAAWRNHDGTIEVLAPVKLIDEVAADMRSAVLEALKETGNGWNGEGEDPGRATILPLLKLQGVFANQRGQYGYPVMNGMEVPEEMILVANLEDAKELVLASDGYPRIAIDGELEVALAEDYLRKALTEDPLCVGVLKSTKGLVSGQESFDDRAWLKITFDE